jgi:hypothetical protein
MLVPIIVKIIPLLMAGFFIVVSPLSGWRHGEVDGYQWDGKIYDEPSQYGIDNGRISKITIKKDGNIVVHYDRGWDVVPSNKEESKVLNKIVSEYKK